MSSGAVRGAHRTAPLGAGDPDARIVGNAAVRLADSDGPGVRNEDTVVWRESLCGW
ncbi:hypothetical protein [Nocardia jejuensis]|uniref:hypothetical protein n=1 Tax=Nocardia jejuensis TaxID=328049 RepID=UPI0012FA8C98|nr:hypothetical protein [Nocardia jejuensis]